MQYAPTAASTHLYKDSLGCLFLNCKEKLTLPKIKRTHLYEKHLSLGARMVPFGGWDMPVQYVGIKAEHAAVRTNVGLFDVSHMGEFNITGSHQPRHTIKGRQRFWSRT